MYDTNRLVLVTHVIDTEGPLRESLDATFERLSHLLGVDDLPHTPETLDLLKEKALPLGWKEELVAQVINGHALSYKQSWQDIDGMLDRIMSEKFRFALPDSYGGGWVFNWHCLDHVGFESNPRGRDLGVHRIFDHFHARLNAQKDCPDGLHYHFHYISTYHEAHRCATSLLNSAHEFLDVLCRRIIERHWFPQVARAGFTAERPDSHWFLEQWIPYDLSNTALDDPRAFDLHTDFRSGRSADWRGAPSDWSVYHPLHDDYRVPGNCRRWIGRALNVLSRIASLTEREVEKAFARADKGQPTLLGIAGHDWRDLGTEVDATRELIQKVASLYPHVRFKYCEAVEAFRRATGVPEYIPDPLELDVAFHPETPEDVPHLDITTRRGRVFGPQPFLAIETMSGRFLHDNLDRDMHGGVWHYPFHSDTLSLSDVRRIGIAANDEFANASIAILDRDSSGMLVPGFHS
ncbi:MAG: hypothetical protein PHX87_00585 [Candidatus Peribacteraceae bacterium]|nr:hypothetical protein [Candidatus Peribacteraceae bacterium]MDD5741904.1 hypothetical protein [Candidatus Peribacteraceae bacterium]